jgi:hypothetical protein
VRLTHNAIVVQPAGINEGAIEMQETKQKDKPEKATEVAGQDERLVMPGDVWRKNGPCDWVKVLRVQMNHNPKYDGGLPGCSVVFTNFKGNWKRKSWFIAAQNTDDFERMMTEEFRFRA